MVELNLEKKNNEKLELLISSKTGEPLKPFIKPRVELLRGIIFIAFGFLWWGDSYFWGSLPIYTDFLLLILSLILGCSFISRAKLGNKHILVHQIIILMSDLFIFFMGFVFSIIFCSILGLLGMVMGIIIIITCTLFSTIHCLYWLVKLEKYKVKN